MVSNDIPKVDIFLEPDSDSSSPQSVGATPATAAHVTDTSPIAKRRWAMPVLFCRILARLLDMIWQSALVFWMINLLLPLLNQSVLNQVLLVAFCVLPLTLTIDFVVQSVFANTPGKKLLGIRVVTWRGGKLSVGDAFTRNFLLWRFGFVCGFVPMVPFGALGQLLRLKRGNRTYYDEQLHLRITQSDRPVIVNLALGCLAVLLLVLGGFIAADRAQLQPGKSFTAQWLPGFLAKNPGFLAKNIEGSKLSSNIDPPDSKGFETLAVIDSDLNETDETQLTQGKTNEIIDDNASASISTEDAQGSLATNVPDNISDIKGKDEPPSIWWTNFDTGFTVQLEAGWQLETETVGKTPAFRLRDTDTVVRVGQAEELNVSLEGFAENYLRLRPEYSDQSIQVPFIQGGHTGLRLTLAATSGEKIGNVIEWLQVGENVNQITLENVTDDVADSVELLRQSLWKTFP